MSERVRDHGVSIESGRADFLPGTWVVVECPECDESWTLDVVDWSPPLTWRGAERLVAPTLLSHVCATGGTDG